MTIHTENWPFDSIEQCRIVLRQGQRQNLSILEIHTADDWERVGLSKRVDLRRVAVFLRDHGVSVSIVGGPLPAHKPSGILTPFNVFRIVMVLLIVVMAIVVASPKRDAPRADERNAHHPVINLPRPQMPGNPQPANPRPPEGPRPRENSPPGPLEMKFPEEEPSEPPVDPFADDRPNTKEHWS